MHAEQLKKTPSQITRKRIAPGKYIQRTLHPLGLGSVAHEGKLKGGPGGRQAGVAPW